MSLSWRDLIFAHVETPKGNTNRCISKICTGMQEFLLYIQTPVRAAVTLRIASDVILFLFIHLHRFNHLAFVLRSLYCFHSYFPPLSHTQNTFPKHNTGRVKILQSRLEQILGKQVPSTPKSSKGAYDSKVSLAQRVVRIERQVDDIESKLDKLLDIYVDERHNNSR